MALFKASTPLFFGVLAMTLAAAPGMAQGRGNRGGGERAPSQGTPGGSQRSGGDRGNPGVNPGGNRDSTFSRGNRGGGQRSVAPPPGRWGGGQQFAGGRDRGERREFRGGFSYYGGSYGRQGGYRRPVYRGNYSSGIYLGLNVPYYGSYYDSYYDPYYDPYYTSPYVYDGYGDDRGYAYEPEYEYGPGPGSSYSPTYAAPTYAPSPCTVDAFDQYGRRIPNPNCNDNAPRYGQQQDNRQNRPYPRQQQPYPNYDRR